MHSELPISIVSVMLPMLGFIPAMIAAAVIASGIGKALQVRGQRKQLQEQQKSAVSTYAQKEKDRLVKAQLVEGVLRSMNYPGMDKITPEALAGLHTPARPYTGPDVTKGSKWAAAGQGLGIIGGMASGLGRMGTGSEGAGEAAGPLASQITPGGPAQTVNTDVGTFTPRPTASASLDNIDPSQLTVEEYLRMLGLDPRRGV